MVLFFIFPDGQGIAVKLHRQIQAAAKRRDTVLQKYNALPQHVTTALYPLELEKNQLMSGAIGVQDESGTNVDFPLPLQKKCIELGYLYERATEEIEMVKAAKPKLVQRFSEQLDVLNQKLCSLEHDLESTVDNLESTLNAEIVDKDLAQNLMDTVQNIKGQISILSNEIDRVSCKFNSIKRRFNSQEQDLSEESNEMDEVDETTHELDDVPAHDIRHFIEWYEENMVEEYNMAYDVNMA